MEICHVTNGIEMYRKDSVLLGFTLVLDGYDYFRSVRERLWQLFSSFLWRRVRQIRSCFFCCFFHCSQCILSWLGKWSQFLLSKPAKVKKFPKRQAPPHPPPPKRSKTRCDRKNISEKETHKCSFRRYQRTNISLISGDFLWTPKFKAHFYKIRTLRKAISHSCFSESKFQDKPTHQPSRRSWRDYVQDYILSTSHNNKGPNQNYKRM